MKKELKELIKKLKLSDDQLITIINSQSKSESEKDTKDEDDELEEPSNSKEKDKVEEKPTTEASKKEELSLDAIQKLIESSIDKALKISNKKEEKEEEKKPIINKDDPKPKIKEDADTELGKFKLVF